MNAQGYRSCLRFVLLVLLGAGSAGVQAAPTNTAAKADRLIRRQMVEAMLYGTDDFFGDTRHLIYADYAARAAARAPEDRIVAQAVKSGGKGGGKVDPVTPDPEPEPDPDIGGDGGGGCST